jgi:hypothetical protein
MVCGVAGWASSLGETEAAMAGAHATVPIRIVVIYDFLFLPISGVISKSTKAERASAIPPF